ncbi:MAG: PKD domain-containing protein [Candidatus Thermoplasmatota archaeon]
MQDVYQNDPNWANYSSFEEQLAIGQLGSEPLYTKQVDVAKATKFYVHVMGAADAPDLDLGIFLDGKDGNPVDGITQTGECIAVCADWDADEEVTIDFPEDGAYLIRVFGFDVTGSPGHFDMDVEISAENSTGILCINSSLSTIIENRVEGCNVGIHTDALSVGHRIYHNNFIANGIHAIEEGSNSWDNGFPSGGNHWDNWTAPDSNRDGFVDYPLVIGNGNQDNYPFAEMWEIDDSMPIADAGDDQIIDQGDTLMFNGSGSVDNVGIVNYSWELFYGDAVRVMYGMFANFTFYSVGNVSVNLTVRDAAGLESLGQMWVNVREVPDPEAAAGEDQNVDQGDIVILNGSESSGSLPLSNYTWVFTYNDTAHMLYGAVAEFAFYTVGNYSVNLTVRDVSGDSGTDQMWVHVRDITPPVAEAGTGQIIGQGEVATLNGSVSIDNVRVVNYTWSFIYNGTSYTLYGEVVTFPFYTVGNYSIDLVVRDGADNSDSDMTWVHVKDTIAPVVVSVFPFGDNVPADTEIRITFSEQMSPSPVEEAITISPGVEISSFVWTDNNRTLRIIMSAKMSYHTTYTVTIGEGAKDVSGKGFTEPYLWNFTTEDAPSPPPFDCVYYTAILGLGIGIACAIVYLWLRRKRSTHPSN